MNAVIKKFIITSKLGSTEQNTEEATSSFLNSPL